jgi:hypothetical protein
MEETVFPWANAVVPRKNHQPFRMRADRNSQGREIPVFWLVTLELYSFHRKTSA